MPRSAWTQYLLLPHHSCVTLVRIALPASVSLLVPWRVVEDSHGNASPVLCVVPAPKGVLSVGFAYFKIFMYYLCISDRIRSQLWHVGSFTAVCGLLSSNGTQIWLPRSTRHLSSPTRDQTHVPCTGKRILNHWTTRVVPLGFI